MASNTEDNAIMMIGKGFLAGLVITFLLFVSYPVVMWRAFVIMMLWAGLLFHICTHQH